MLLEVIFYAFPLLELACGVAIVVRFRGSPGAVLGGIAFGVLVATNITRRVLGALEIDWWEYNLAFTLLNLAAYGCLLAALITGRVYIQAHPAAGERGATHTGERPLAMNQSSALTLGSWFSRGWKTYKANFRLLVGVSVMFIIPDIILALVPGLWLLYFVIGPPLVVGVFFLYLKAVRDEKPNFSVVFAGFSIFGKAWLTVFLYYLILFGGIFLLVIPGIIWGMRYGLSLFAVLDRSLSAREAIRLSGKITYGYKVKLFVTALVMGLISSLPQMPLGFGLGLLRAGDENALPLLAIAIVPYLVSRVLLSPRAFASWASAYDSLVNRWQQSSMGTQETESSGTS